MMNNDKILARVFCALAILTLGTLYFCPDFIAVWWVGGVDIAALSLCLIGYYLEK